MQFEMRIRYGERMQKKVVRASELMGHANPTGYRALTHILHSWARRWAKFKVSRRWAKPPYVVGS